MRSVKRSHRAASTSRVDWSRTARLTIIEGRAALGWLATHWPGTLPELRRRLPRLEPIVDELDAHALLEQALALADTGEPLPSWPLLGRLPSPVVNRRGMADTARRMWGRMPWTSRRQDAYRIYSVPVGGEGGVKNPNLPPPSRPEDEEIEISPNQRAGVPYQSGTSGPRSSCPITWQYSNANTPLR